jgi:hypothetical protein
LPVTSAMIWIIDTIKTHLFIQEADYDLDVPIQVEIEYRVRDKEVSLSSVSKKIYYNRPLLVKEAKNFSEEEIDKLINQSVQKAIENHFTAKGYTFNRTI